MKTSQFQSGLNKLNSKLKSEIGNNKETRQQGNKNEKKTKEQKEGKGELISLVF